MMVFDKRPFCIAGEVKDIKPNYYRMDFCYMVYTPEKVQKITHQLLELNNVSDCICGNFLGNNI